MILRSDGAIAFIPSNVDATPVASAHVSHFERSDPFVGAVRTMFHARRTTRIHTLLEKLFAIPLAAFQDIDLLPKIMDESFGTSAARVDLQHTCNEHLV